MKVLIIDDQESNRYLLRSLLEANACQVAEAADGKKALEMLEEAVYDLVISDILMPVMDGYQLCREVRSRARLRNLPFVFLTATYIDEKDEAFALKLGADRFYRKPIDPRVFMDAIKALMEEITNGKKRRPTVQGDEKEILTLYNKRLIHKLETKMASLEKEVAERKLAEEIAQAVLKEKEVLLREVHHRVKNNMQVISSLINLSVRDLKDPATLDVLRQIQLRIRSMSMIHDKLMKSGDLVHIDFADFLNDMAIHCSQFCKVDPDRIELRLDVESVIIPIGLAVPCGLIAGEMMSNALKHAFPANRRGEVVVGLKRLSGNEVLLSVCDNGVGLPAEMDVKKTETIGMTILKLLVGQINGRLEVVREKGSDFRVVFGLGDS